MTPVGPIAKTAHDQEVQIKLTIIIDWGALPARAVFDHLLIVKCLRRVDYATKNFILASFSSAQLHRGNVGWRTPIRLVASSATAWITKGNTDAVAPHSRTAESITSCRQETSDVNSSPLISTSALHSCRSDLRYKRFVCKNVRWAASVLRICEGHRSIERGTDHSYRKSAHLRLWDRTLFVLLTLPVPGHARWLIHR